MNSAIERLLSLRVSDIMNPEVVPIPVTATIAEAAATLDRHGISGAPVIDAEGRCVGVLSVTDLALRELRMAQVGESITWSFDALTAKDSVREMIPSNIDPDELVADHMSPVVQTIDMAAPIMNAARLLCREHIHRLIIVDPRLRPIGVVSSLDLVASMVAAVDE